jgi:hypothetical protein
MSAAAHANRSEQDKHHSGHGEDPVGDDSCGRDALLRQGRSVALSAAASWTVLEPSVHQSVTDDCDQEQVNEGNPGECLGGRGGTCARV